MTSSDDQVLNWYAMALISDLKQTEKKRKQDLVFGHN